MINHWYSDMAFLRIGPETGILAGQLLPPLRGHDPGCLCPECTELRASVSRYPARDKHVAEVMESKERGRIAAGQEIILQRRREAAARAEVARELDGYGAYPYRAGGQRWSGSDWHEPGCGCGCEKPGDGKQLPPELETSDCTCTPPAWDPGSPYWAAHKAGCPMRARLSAQAGKKALAREKQLKAKPAPEPARTTPGQEIQAELAAFDTWRLAGPHYPDELAHPERAPAGTCAECHLGLAVSGGRCFWCQLAVTVKNENRGLESLAEHGPDHVPCGCRACSRRAFRHKLYVLLLIWAGAAVVLLTVSGVINWRLS